jgi:hypothetical protein
MADPHRVQRVATQRHRETHPISTKLATSIDARRREVT